MKRFVGIWKLRKSVIASILLTAFCFSANVPQMFAHGGEDHGDSQPKITTGVKGTVSRAVRLGSFEVLVKHPTLEPDKAAAALLFVTKFETNEAADKVTPAVEIESAVGSVTKIPVEKTDTIGSYHFKIPALPDGAYTLRTKLTYAGETDTATFSGVEVENAPVVSAESFASRIKTTLMILSALVVSGLFGGLIYFAVSAAKEGARAREESVSV